MNLYIIIVFHNFFCFKKIWKKKRNLRWAPLRSKNKIFNVFLEKVIFCGYTGGSSKGGGGMIRNYCHANNKKKLRGFLFLQKIEIKIWTFFVDNFGGVEFNVKVLTNLGGSLQINLGLFYPRLTADKTPLFWMPLKLSFETLEKSPSFLGSFSEIIIFYF